MEVTQSARVSSSDQPQVIRLPSYPLAISPTLIFWFYLYFLDLFKPSSKCGQEFLFWLIVSGFVSPYVSAESEVTEAGPIECIFGTVGFPEDFGVRKENRGWTLSPGPCTCYVNVLPLIYILALL